MKAKFFNIPAKFKIAMVMILAIVLVIIMIPNPFATTTTQTKIKVKNFKKFHITVNTVYAGDRKIKGKISKVTAVYITGKDQYGEPIKSVRKKQMKNTKGYRVVARLVVNKKMEGGQITDHHFAGPKVGKYFLGKKKYKAKVRKNGTFTIKGLPKNLKEDQKIKISLYKGKKFKRTKVIQVQYKDVVITPQIYNNILRKAKTARTEIRHESDGKTPKYYISSNHNCYEIGDPNKYLTTIHQPYNSRDPYSEMKSLNGATIYLNVLWTAKVTEEYEMATKYFAEGVSQSWTPESLEQWYQAAKAWDWKGFNPIPDPSPQNYQYIVYPNKTVHIYGTDFPDIWQATQRLYYKAVVYVNGKFVAADCGVFNHAPTPCLEFEWR